MKLVPPKDPARPYLGNHSLESHSREQHSLEQLLCRGDIWRGRSHQAPPRLVVDTGYAELNARLAGGGWPVAHLMEVCQRAACHGEWQLLLPALLTTQRGLVVLLNPPVSPFAQALLNAGIDLERLIIVEATHKADFLTSFIELARCDACDAVMAWQPVQALSYTELRKCALAAKEGQGIVVLFRPDTVRDQSSPAVIRLHLEWHAEQLSVSIFKQRGDMLPDKSPINLPLPSAWKKPVPDQPVPQHSLDQPNSAGILPIRNGRPTRR